MCNTVKRTKECQPSPLMLVGYTRCDDGLYRKRVTFAEPSVKAPMAVVRSVVLVRSPQGNLIKAERRPRFYVPRSNPKPKQKLETAIAK